jgi:hypothetical protein
MPGHVEGEEPNTMFVACGDEAKNRGPMIVASDPKR